MSRSNAVAVFTLAALASLAAGCATSPSSAPVAHAQQAAPSGVLVVQDQAYVQRVEQIAKRRGIGVTWVNPPTKRRVAATP
jgi:membrane-bound lytic murein transglycosylase B